MSDKTEDENESSIKQATLLEQPDFNVILKPLWIDLSRKHFDLLIKNVDDNLDNKNYKTGVAGNDHNLKNAKAFLQETSTKKISQNEAHQLYNSLIKPDVNVLSKTKSRSENKRENVLTVLNKIKTVFIFIIRISHQNQKKVLRGKQIRKTKI